MEDTSARYRGFKVLELTPGYDRELIVGNTPEAIAELLVLGGLKPTTAEEAVAQEEARKKKEAESEQFNKQRFGRRTRAEEESSEEEALKQDAEAEGKAYARRPPPKEKSIPELMARYDYRLLRTLGDACLIPFVFGQMGKETPKGLDDGRDLEALLNEEFDTSIEEILAKRKGKSQRK